MRIIYACLRYYVTTASFRKLSNDGLAPVRLLGQLHDHMLARSDANYLSVHSAAMRLRNSLDRNHILPA